MVFEHAWLTVGITPPGSTTATDYELDPSWKFDDLQAGLSGILTAVPFVSNDSAGTYLNPSSTQVENETAADYYEGLVGTYLATSDPSMTVADAAYDGPIQPQSITSLPTTLPYSVVSPSTPSPSARHDSNHPARPIPHQRQHPGGRRIDDLYNGHGR